MTYPSWNRPKITERIKNELRNSDPLTNYEIAERVDCNHRSAQKALSDLSKSGEVFIAEFIRNKGSPTAKWSLRTSSSQKHAPYPKPYQYEELQRRKKIKYEKETQLMNSITRKVTLGVWGI